MKTKLNQQLKKLLQKIESKYSQLENSVAPKLESTELESEPIKYEYNVPGYYESDTKTRSSILVGKYQTIKIIFSDGTKGEINRTKNGEYFLWEGRFFPNYIAYHDKKSCINGLHYYLKYGEFI